MWGRLGALMGTVRGEAQYLLCSVDQKAKPKIVSKKKAHHLKHLLSKEEILSLQGDPLGAVALLCLWQL